MHRTKVTYKFLQCVVYEGYPWILLRFSAICEKKKKSYADFFLDDCTFGVNTGPIIGKHYSIAGIF